MRSPFLTSLTNATQWEGGPQESDLNSNRGRRTAKRDTTEKKKGGTRPRRPDLSGVPDVSSQRPREPTEPRRKGQERRTPREPRRFSQKTVYVLLGRRIIVCLTYLRKLAQGMRRAKKRGGSREKGALEDGKNFETKEKRKGSSQKRGPNIINEAVG